MSQPVAGAGGRPLAVLVLAGGRGRRMKSRLPKSLHPVAGKPMLACALDAAAELAPEHTLVVHAPNGAALREAFAERARFVEQDEPRGTGHAVQIALPELAGFSGELLVLYGDCPLLRPQSLLRLRETRAQSGAPLALLTSPEPLPGRVLRDAQGRVEAIVEESDATPQELEIREGNTGVMLAEIEHFSALLGDLDTNNKQGELYLTGLVALTRRRGQEVCALRLDDADEALGVNTRSELARACAVQFRRNAEALMAEGVTFVDPNAAYIDTGVRIGRDSVIEPGVVITAPSRLGEGVHVKAHSVVEAALLGDGVQVGPSAHLRPGAEVGAGARIGNFVEVKNSTLGPGVKADHLAYIGDAEVGAGAAIGCGAITVNYDWEQKHRTVIGAGARIGCNANLVAPVELEAGSFVAAGTTVTKKVGAGELAVGGPRQKNLKGWGKRRRPKDTGAKKGEEGEQGEDG